MGAPGVKARTRMWSVGNEHRGSKRHAAGVTLLELLVVITILSLISGLVVPRMGPWLDNWRLRSAADRIAQTLRYARTRALFEQHFYVVEILPEKNLMRVFEPNSAFVRESALPKGIQVRTDEKEGASGGPEVIRFILPPSGEVEEKNVWLRNEQGQTIKVHFDFLMGSPGVEIARQGS
jgi:prepilin-type N-terminal cleavage/methylation domain-containing protein